MVERERELLVECRTAPQACVELGERKLEAVDDPISAPLAAAFLSQACIRGSARGCADLAVLRAQGRGVVRDEARARVLARGACEAGARNGCFTWARLLSTEPFGTADGGAQRAMERSCTQGQPEACTVVSRLADGNQVNDQGLVLEAAGAAPAVPPAAAGALEERAGVWAETCAEAYLEPKERGALGIGSEALAQAQPSVNDLRLARPLGELVGRAVAGCVCPPGGGITVALRLGVDGRAFEVRASRPEAEGCVRERIAALDLPAPRSATGLLWWNLRDLSQRTLPPAGAEPPDGQDGDEEERQEAARERGCPNVPPRPKRLAGWPEKYVKPREVTKGCAGRAIGSALERRVAGLNARMTLKFAVGKDGQVSRLEVVYPAGQNCDVVLQLKKAVQSCAFEPGRDDQGQPQKIWMILPIVFRAD